MRHTQVRMVLKKQPPLTVCVLLLCVSDLTELHVHHAERQQSHSSKDLLRCHG